MPLAAGTVDAGNIRSRKDVVPHDRERGATAQVCPVPQPRHDQLAQGPQEAVPFQVLRLRKVQPDSGATARHGSPGEYYN